MSSPTTTASDPTSRSRTLLFISYRDSQARASRYSRSRRTRYGHIDDGDGDDDEAQRLIRSADDPLAEAAALDVGPQWLEISDQVEAAIVDTRNKILALDKLHAKHVLPGFKDRSDEEREIELRTNEITREFRRCHSLIQRISASASSHTFPPNIAPSQNDVTSAQNVQRALAAKVQDLSALFRTKQKVYMQKLQGHAISRNDQMIASGVLSSNGTNMYDSVQRDEEASRSQLSAMQSDPSLASRNHEISEIAKSIVSLAELFKDLSNLVIDQGTILDSVEYNIQQTAIHMEDAVKELDIATRYQRNTGRRMCIFLLLLIIFGLVLVLIFKPRKHSQPADAPTPSRMLYFD